MNAGRLNGFQNAITCCGYELTVTINCSTVLVQRDYTYGTNGLSSDIDLSILILFSILIAFDCAIG